MPNLKEKQGQSLAFEQAQHYESKLMSRSTEETTPTEALAREGLEAANVSVKAERGSTFLANHDIQPSGHSEQKSIYERVVSVAPLGILAGYLLNTLAFVQIFNFVYGAYHGFNKTRFSTFFGKSMLAGAFIGLSLGLFSTFVFPPAYIVSAITGTTLTPVVASALLGVVTTAAMSIWWCAGRVIRAGVDIFIR